jgi:zinc/manganese transport system ATP-binding protein
MTSTRAEVPCLGLHQAGVDFGSEERQLWSGLDLDVQPGEFLAVLGGNGSGKTTLLRCILGLQPLTSGSLEIGGMAARAARRYVGYVPQQRRVDPLTPLRARDLVGLGLDGHRWGIAGRGRERAARIEAALAAVDALAHADRPVALLSGGQQQLVRIAQALAGDPLLLLCDEPLLSLDLHHQRAVASVVNQRRLAHSTAVVFVTHEINPILPYVDRVLYLAEGRFRVGTVDEVLTSAVLSDLYDAPVDVLRVNGRIVVAGIPEPADDGRHDQVLVERT